MPNFADDSWSSVRRFFFRTPASICFCFHHRHPEWCPQRVIINSRTEYTCIILYHLRPVLRIIQNAFQDIPRISKIFQVIMLYMMFNVSCNEHIFRTLPFWMTSSLPSWTGISRPFRESWASQIQKNQYGKHVKIDHEKLDVGNVEIVDVLNVAMELRWIGWWCGARFCCVPYKAEIREKDGTVYYLIIFISRKQMKMRSCI